MDSFTSTMFTIALVRSLMRWASCAGKVAQHHRPRVKQAVFLFQWPGSLVTGLGCLANQAELIAMCSRIFVR
jgi:hypothetical protein